MSDLPKDLGDLLANAADLTADIAFVRAMRGLRVATINGDVALNTVPGAQSVSLDLRNLSATSVPSTSDIPPQNGHSGAFLFSNGASAFWQTVPLFTAWEAAVVANGGTFTANSRRLAARLAYQISISSFAAKLVYFLPFLGANLAAARVPLIDSLAKGPAVNHNFVDADFTEALGLQGNGTTKYLDSTITPAACGSSNDGGLGWWENHFSAGFANVEPMGCYKQSNSPDDRFVIDMRSTRTIFSWGNVTTIANDGTPASNGHFYGNRSSNTSRILYKNGVQTAAATTDDAATGTADNTILICGSNEGTGGGITPWAGRGAAAYITNGTMTAAEVAAFHAILNSNLVTPLGR